MTCSLRCAGAASLQYTVENTTKKPLEKPRNKRPTYRPAVDVDPICSDTPAKQIIHASHSAFFRPKYVPKTPAAMADKHDPRFSKEVMSCCTVDCPARQ
jgi:hypothetical protein